jgi:hypothetical protein
VEQKRKTAAIEALIEHLGGAAEVVTDHGGTEGYPVPHGMPCLYTMERTLIQAHDDDGTVLPAEPLWPLLLSAVTFSVTVESLLSIFARHVGHIPVWNTLYNLSIAFVTQTCMRVRFGITRGLPSSGRIVPLSHK